MSRQQVLQQIVAVTLMLFLIGCGSLTATPVSESQLAISTPELAAATPTPEPPTSTPVPSTPTPSLGVIKGKLIGAESQKPLTRASVILCIVTVEKKCRLKANLVTTANEDGSFELTKVPSASYVVFYDTSGEAKVGWKDIDGLEMVLKLNEGLSPFPSSGRTEFFSTFGGEGAISVQKGTTLEWDEEGVFNGNGSVISEEYGLTMDFYEGKPITIETQPGKITELEIRAWTQ